jgi:hypothetical protein
MTHHLDYGWVASHAGRPRHHSARRGSPQARPFRSRSIGLARWRITRCPREPTSPARTRSRTARANVPLGTYNVTVTDTATGAQASASIDVVAPATSTTSTGTTTT